MQKKNISLEIHSTVTVIPSQTKNVTAVFGKNLIFGNGYCN